MDPLSALSVAAAVVQFVDFGSHLLLDTAEHYKSTTGQNSRNVELSTISERLLLLATDVESLSGKMRKPRQGSAAERLKTLCGDCKSVNAEMQLTLAKLQASGASKLDLAKNSFVVALKGVLSDGKLRGLKERMDKIRRDMTMPTLVCLWYNDNLISPLLSEIANILGLGKKPKSRGKLFINFCSSKAP